MSFKEPWPERGMYFEPTTVRIDRSAAKALARNKQVSARNKHIDLKYHFVKAALKSKIITLKDVKSACNTPDIVTKVLDLPTTLHLSRKFCLTRDQLRFLFTEIFHDDFISLWYIFLF